MGVTSERLYLHQIVLIDDFCIYNDASFRISEKNETTLGASNSEICKQAGILRFKG